MRVNFLNMFRFRVSVPIFVAAVFISSMMLVFFIYPSEVFAALGTPIIHLDFEPYPNDTNPLNTYRNKGSDSVTDYALYGPLNFRSQYIPVSGAKYSVNFGTSSGPYVVESAGVPAIGPLNNFTITGWINNRVDKEGTGGNRILSWMSADGSTGVDVLYRKGGSIELKVGGLNTASPIRMSGIPTDLNASYDNWRFFAIKYSSTDDEISLFLGSNTKELVQSILTTTYSAGFLPSIDANVATLVVGNSNTLSWQAGQKNRIFRGIIDDIRIYPDEISNSDIFVIQGLPAQPPLRDGVNLYGYAWSSAAGWISFNSKNCDLDEDGQSDGTVLGCPTMGTILKNYSVKYDVSNSRLFGYAWSNLLGWIKFDGFKSAEFPVAGGTYGTVTANVTKDSNNNLYGWARAIHPSLVKKSIYKGDDTLIPNSVNKMNVSCNGDPVVATMNSTNYFTAHVSGGRPPYLYSWRTRVGEESNGLPWSNFPYSFSRFSIQVASSPDVPGGDNIYAMVTVKSADSQTASASCSFKRIRDLTSPDDIISDLPNTNYCLFSLSEPGSVSVDLYNIGLTALRSDENPVKIGPIPVALAAGRYTVRLFGFDGYDGRETVSQPGESFKMQFNTEISGEDKVVAVTASTPDLDDNIRAASMVKIVEEEIEIPNPVTSVTFVHSLYEELKDFTVISNDIYPVCAQIDPVESVPDPFWDGWISMKGNDVSGTSNYGVSVNIRNELEGYAWGSDMLGWIGFNCNGGGTNSEDICSQSNYKVSFFKPYTYTLSIPPGPYSSFYYVPQGGTVVIPVTGTYSRAVTSNDYVNLIVSDLGSHLSVEGVPRCIPDYPDYETCSGNLTLRAASAASLIDKTILVTTNPMPTNWVTPQAVNIRITFIGSIPPFTLNGPSSPIDVYEGMTVNVPISIVYVAPVAENMLNPSLSVVSNPSNVQILGFSPYAYVAPATFETKLNIKALTVGSGQVIFKGTPVSSNGDQNFQINVLSLPVNVDLTIENFNNPSQFTTAADGTLIVPNGANLCAKWVSSNALDCKASGGPMDWVAPNNGIRPLQNDLCLTSFQDPQNPTVTGPYSNVTNNFSLTCSTGGFNATDLMRVRAIPPTVDLKANRMDNKIKISVGSRVKLTWDLHFAGGNCQKLQGGNDPGWGGAPIFANSVVVSGNYITSPILTETTYQIMCPNGVTDTITIIPQKNYFQEI